MAVTILLCYVHQDEKMAGQLKKHLSPLERREMISIQDYGNISPGAEREQEMNKYLDEAQIILLLISAEFLNTHYHYKGVMQETINRHERKEARVIPVIMRPVHWEGSPFDKLQVLPKNAKPIMKWTPRDEGYADVVGGILRVVNEWETHSLPEPLVERRIVMAYLDQLIATVTLQMQPPGRANATANTLQQLSIFTPNETTLADLIVGWRTLSHAAKEEEEPATIQRRVTCSELAQLASQFTTDQGNLAQAIKTWHSWLTAFKNSDDPRQTAMAKTFTRELTELQENAN